MTVLYLQRCVENFSTAEDLSNALFQQFIPKLVLPVKMNEFSDMETSRRYYLLGDDWFFIKFQNWNTGS